MAVLTEPERSLSAVPIISGVVQAQSLHAKIALRIPARTLTPRSVSTGSILDARREGMNAAAMAAAATAANPPT